MYYFSSSRGAGGTQSRSEAAQIFRQTSREKPVAKVKPMIRDEETSAAEPNLLGDLLKRQNEFLKPADRSTFELREPAHQKEVGISQCCIWVIFFPVCCSKYNVAVGYKWYFVTKIVLTYCEKKFKQ